MMMMIGDHHNSNPTVQIPPWDYHFLEDPTPHIHSGSVTHANSPDASHYENALAALQRYLPSNKDDVVPSEDDDCVDDFDVPVDAFSCDNFRMFEFKVKKCALARSHDWTECPFAHPGEKARRRDPRKYHYSGSACPDFRRGACKRGDACASTRTACSSAGSTRPATVRSRARMGSTAGDESASSLTLRSNSEFCRTLLAPTPLRDGSCKTRSSPWVCSALLRSRLCTPPHRRLRRLDRHRFRRPGQ
ncbi:UNVERIFIED_CONTAM: Zinc finger CCCH domain-containing protein 49 [Sesamum latifolium]|uniref:Zinc finger CCCH domain-containing protein 49 n=1 Tax=Sesamum latifolium TaxID=2727402 RepID=A0AAW2WZP4_9LAMI